MGWLDADGFKSMRSSMVGEKTLQNNFCFLLTLFPVGCDTIG